MPNIKFHDLVANQWLIITHRSDFNIILLITHHHLLPLKPQLTLFCFSANSAAGLVVLTKVNCTSSVTKDYREKKIRPYNQLSNKCVNLILFCYKFILCTLSIFHERVLNMTDMKTRSRVPQWWRVITIWRRIWISSSPRQNLLKS